MPGPRAAPTGQGQAVLDGQLADPERRNRVGDGRPGGRNGGRGRAVRAAAAPPGGAVVQEPVIRSRLSSLSNSTACATMSREVVAGRCARRASLVSSSARQDREAIRSASAIAWSAGPRTDGRRRRGRRSAPRRRQHLAGIEHSPCNRQADGLRQPPVGARPGHDAQAQFGLGELRPRRGDPQVAGQGQLAATTVGRPVDAAMVGQRCASSRSNNPELIPRNAASESRSTISAMSAPAAKMPGVVEYTISTHGSRRAVEQCPVDLVDHRLVDGVVLAGPVKAEQQCTSRGVLSRRRWRAVGHWSKSTTTRSVTGWDWQVSTNPRWSSSGSSA